MARVTRHHTKRVERPIKVDSIVAKFRQWATIKHETAALTTRQNHLRDEISAYVDKHGVKDNRGSLFLDLDTPVEVGDQVFRQIKRERRVSTSFDEEAAEALLESKGLLAEAQTTITVLDQDKVYVLNQEGKITDEEIDSLFVQRESWAFKPIAD